MELDALAAAFPVLERTAYLNAGSCGPTATVTAEAVEQASRQALQEGRGLAYYDGLRSIKADARAAWGELLDVDPRAVALTAGASDGIARTLACMSWAAGDEVVTSDEEHPGVLGPLGALARRHGVVMRMAPWDDLAGALGDRTRLVVCSHVGWLSGRVAVLDGLRGSGVPVLLDAAQSAGAIPVDLVDLARSGVVAYAAAGQKWTCGPVGTGALWTDPAWRPDEGAGVWPTYDNLEDPAAGLAARPWTDARRLDAPSLSSELLGGGLAALRLLAGVGWARVHAAGVDRAARVARALLERGREVAPRGPSTLVAWRSDDPAAEVMTLAAAGVAVRGFEGQPWVRASIGAWTTDAHVDRLLDLVT